MCALRAALSPRTSAPHIGQSAADAGDSAAGDGAASNSATDAGDSAASNSAAGDGAAAGGVSLKNGAGKNVAKLRSWSEALGCGIALCRMEALQGDAPLERDDDGSGLMLPHRPSWWPERIK